MKLYTTKAVAVWLDLTESRVRQLKKDKVITEYSKGLYDLQTVTHEYINYLRKNGTDGKLDYNSERALLVQAKRKNQELELNLRLENVHETEEIRQVLSDVLVKFKTRLLAVPAKLSPLLAKKTDSTEIFTIMKDSLDEVLEELSDFKTLFKN